MKRPDFSLKWLRVFRAVARTGSLQATADQTGLSISTVSHHLARLEAHVGTGLIDHSRRPMAPTSAGLQFLRSVEDALAALDRGAAELTATTPGSLRQLRFAMIDDFENDIGPDITRMLASALPGCQFTHLTRVSHEILDLLRAGDLDMGLATRPATAPADMTETPLLRDPFVLAVPAATTATAEALIAGDSDLAFLRYNPRQIIGGMVAAQLTRLRITLPNAFALDSTASLMSLIAHGDGWAITTPSNYIRAKRFQPQIKLLPFPGKEFARTISIFVAQPQAQEIAQNVATAMRSLLATHAVGPAVAAYPWLRDSYRLVD